MSYNTNNEEIESDNSSMISYNTEQEPSEAMSQYQSNVAPYGIAADGLPRLKPGRKPIYTPEQRREKRNRYLRERYHMRQQELERLRAEDLHRRREALKSHNAEEMNRKRMGLNGPLAPPRIIQFKPVIVTLSSINGNETYELRSRMDLIAFIDFALSFIQSKGLISGYSMSEGINTRERIRPRELEDGGDDE